MFVTDTSKQKQYHDGYNNGYNWLAEKRWNFVHPSQEHGYVPGGAQFYTRANFNEPGYRTELALTYEYNKAWRNGWIDGINQYVRDNDLDFPMVDNIP